MEGEKFINYFKRKINYYETDGMRVVHHSNYIRWFEEARIDFLEKAGMPYEKMEEEGIMIPVLSVSCEYKIPLHFGDTFRIESYITKFNGVKLNVAYEVFNDKTDKLCVTGTTTHCFVNMDFKPVRTKKDYPEIYKAFADKYNPDISE